MSIFDRATPLNVRVTEVTADLYWEVPTDPISFVRAHTDDLDIVAVTLNPDNLVTGEITSYNPHSQCGMVHHSGENVDGHGKRGAPREIITVDLSCESSTSAIFFAARVIKGEGLHHSQHSKLTICAGDAALHTTKISGNASMNGMHSAIVGALLLSPQGRWHHLPLMITSPNGYTEAISNRAFSALAELMFE